MSNKYSIKDKLLNESLPNLGTGKNMTRGSWGVRGASVAMAWVKANFPNAKLVSYAPAASIKKKNSPAYATHLDAAGNSYVIPMGPKQSVMDLVWESGGKRYNAEVKSVRSFTVPATGNKLKLKLTLEVKEKGHMRGRLFPKGHDKNYQPVTKGKGKLMSNAEWKSLFKASNKTAFDTILSNIGKKWGRPTNADAKRAFIHELVHEKHDFVIFVGDTHAVGASMADLNAATVNQANQNSTFSNYGTSGSTFRPALSLTFEATIGRLQRTAGTAAQNPVLGTQTGQSGSFLIDDILDPGVQAALIIDYIDIVQKQYRPSWEYIFQQVDNSIKFKTKPSRSGYNIKIMDVTAWLDGADSTVLNSSQEKRKVQSTKDKNAGKPIDNMKHNTIGFQSWHQVDKNPAKPQEGKIWKYEDPDQYPCAIWPKNPEEDMPEVDSHFTTRATNVRAAIKRIREYYFNLPNLNEQEREDKMYFGMFAHLKGVLCTKNKMINIDTDGCGGVVDLADRLNCKPVSDSNHIRLWENVLYELISFNPATVAAVVDKANPEDI